jgi:hypothetical protein
VPEEVQLIDAVPVSLKRRMLFESGTDIIAKITSAEWMQGKFSPGIATEFKTVSPAIGYSLRTTLFLSTRRDDGSHFVKTGGELDLLLNAVLTPEEFFMQDSVDPTAWVGRPIAFKVEVLEYETQNGEPRKTNTIMPGTFRQPSEEELGTISNSLTNPSTLRKAIEQASDAKGEAKAPEKSSEASEEIDETDFENIPF